MKQNFRANYIHSLGLSDSTQLNREGSVLESLLQESPVDLVRLRSLVEKYEVPQKYRSIIWKHLLDAIPEHKESFPFVCECQKEMYQDIKHHGKIAMASAVLPLISRSINAHNLEEIGRINFLSKRRQSVIEMSKLSNNKMKAAFTTSAGELHASPKGFTGFGKSLSSDHLEGSPFSSSLSLVSDQIVPSSKASEIGMVYLTKQQYILGQDPEDEESTYDMLRMAEVFYQILGDEVSSFVCLCNLLEYPFTSLGARDRVYPANESFKATPYYDVPLEIFFDRSYRDSVTKRQIKELERILAVVDPSLSKLLEDKEISVGMLVERWLRSRFSSCMSIDKLARLWDKMIAINSPDFLIYVALALLQTVRGNILEETERKEIVQSIQNIPITNIDGIIKKSVELMQLSKQNPSSFKPRTSISKKQEASEVIHIKISIQYQTHYGQVLCIAGSVPELGSWNNARMKQMTWNQGDTWTTELVLKRTSLPFEYKYNVFDTLTKRVVTWETFPANRKMDCRSNNPIFETEDSWGVLNP